MTQARTLKSCVPPARQPFRILGVNKLQDPGHESTRRIDLPAMLKRPGSAVWGTNEFYPDGIE